MRKSINVNVIREKDLTNNNGKKFHIVEVKPNVVFILDEEDNFIDSYCGDIDEDETNLSVINNL